MVPVNNSLKTDQYDQKEKLSGFKQALPQILAVCVKNVLLLSLGMTLGFPTILIPSLSGDNSNETFTLGPEAISWIGSLNLICVPVGCVMSGAITQPLGRRRAMQLVNIPFLISWVLFYFANDVWQIFLALAIQGVSGGLLEAPVLTYVAEITEPRLRGILAATSSVSVISGILLQFLLGTFFSWRIASAISAIAPVLSAIFLMFVPESPHWLVSKNRFDDAKKSLAWLRGWVTLEEVNPEFKELCVQMAKGEQIGMSVLKSKDAKSGDESKMNKSKMNIIDTLKLYTKKNFWWPYSLVIFSFFLGHFCGMSTLQTYAVKIFSTLKSPVDKYYATIMLGVAELLGAILSCCLVYKLGKRRIAFMSLLGCGSCFLTVATYAYLIDVRYLENLGVNTTNKTIALEDIGENNTLKNNLIQHYSWIPTVFLVTAAFFVHSGIRILPWMLIGEVYSEETRANASGLSGGMSYLFGFFVNKIFLTIIYLITLPGTFWFYSSVSFIGTIILYFVLPETEGRTLHEITEHFAGNSQLDNKVHNFKKKEVNKNGIDNSGFKSDDYSNESAF